MNKYIAGGTGAILTGVVMAANAASAAVDADFEAAVASTTGNINDTVPTILSYVSTTGGKALLITVLLGLVFLGIAMIRGSIGRRKKK